jgi:hypothetical protein
LLLEKMSKNKERCPSSRYWSSEIESWHLNLSVGFSFFMTKTSIKD